MSDIVELNKSIEGLSAEGTSRDLLMPRGWCLHKGKDCCRYTVSFDVKAKIASQIPEGISKIEDDACCALDAQIRCDKAIIHSLDDRVTSTVSSNVSATHGANSWHFPKQTNVKITRPHKEIENAIRKRRMKQLSA